MPTLCYQDACVAANATHTSRAAVDDNLLHTTANTANLGPVFLGVDWAVFSSSTIIVVLRLYTRLWITRNFGWDHITIALTQVLEKTSFGRL